MTPPAIALVLAAGFSRRFGEDKRWTVLRSGKPMIEQVLAQIAAAQIPAHVVLRADDPHRSAHAWSVPTLVISADDAGRGLGASIAAATRQLPDDQSVLICLGDLPYIKPETYRAVADALAEHRLVAPVFRGQRGHPVGFGAYFLPELRHLDGDSGAREILQRHRDQVFELAVDDPGALHDIDTVADLLVSL